MDPDTVATVAQAASGAATAVKSIVETLKMTRRTVKGNSEAEDKLSDSIQLVLDLQTRLLDLQEKAFRLQGELAQLQEQNSSLREEIRKKEAGAAERQQYQRKKVGGAVVLVREEEPDIYYCPACFVSKNQAILLQPMPRNFRSFGSHRCSQCKAHFQIS